jgi:hypothetical protein
VGLAHPLGWVGGGLGQVSAMDRGIAECLSTWFIWILTPRPVFSPSQGGKCHGNPDFDKPPRARVIKEWRKLK